MGWKKGQKLSEEHRQKISEGMKQDGYVSTFQGRKSAPDGRWQRDKRREVPMLFPLFWEMYESITLSGKDRNRDRGYWLDFLQRKIHAIWEFEERIDLLNEVGEDPLFIRDDLNALWAIYYEWVESTLSWPRGTLPFHYPNLEPGHRPVVWWYGAIDDFIEEEETKTQITLSPKPIPGWNVQTIWLRKHGYLSPTEERDLKEIYTDSEDRLNRFLRLLHGTDLEEIYKINRSEYLKKNPELNKTFKHRR